MTCAPPRPPPAPVSVATSRPFSVTIRLKTSPTERTPSPGFQSHFPAMTRARPANLSDSVPASFDRAVCVVCARSGAGLSTAAIATAPATVFVRIVRIDISWLSAVFRLLCGPRSRSYRLHEKPGARYWRRTSLYDGESTIPQLHNDHHDIDRQARFCYRWEEVIRSTSGGGVLLFDDLRALVEFARAGS